MAFACVGMGEREILRGLVSVRGFVINDLGE